MDCLVALDHGVSPLGREQEMLAMLSALGHCFGEAVKGVYCRNVRLETLMLMFGKKITVNILREKEGIRESSHT